MRGADPAIVLVPGVGMFSFGATSRPPGSPGSSTSMPSTSCAGPSRCRPTPRSARPRSSGSSTGRSRRRSSPGCHAQAAGHEGGVRHRCGVGDRQGDRPAAGGRGRLCRGGRHRPGQRRDRCRGTRRAGRGDRRGRRRERRGAGRRRVPGGGPGLRRGRPRRQQRRPVDLEAAARDDGRATGTSSTTSWPVAPSSSRARRPGS